MKDSRALLRIFRAVSGSELSKLICSAGAHIGGLISHKNHPNAALLPDTTPTVSET
jgi:hypothetical protein